MLFECDREPCGAPPRDGARGDLPRPRGAPSPVNSTHTPSPPDIAGHDQNRAQHRVKEDRKKATSETEVPCLEEREGLLLPSGACGASVESEKALEEAGLAARRWVRIVSSW
eukprot:2184475-Rhodomonas_salina.2